MSVHRNGDLYIIDTNIQSLSSQKESLNNMFDDYIQLIHDQYKQIMSVINGDVRESSFIDYSIVNHNNHAKQNTGEIEKNEIIEMSNEKNEEIIDESEEIQQNIEGNINDNVIEETADNVIGNVIEEKNENLRENCNDNGDVYEWMTDDDDDDESFSGITAQTSIAMTKKLKKKKISEYFTPPVNFTRTMRTATRIMSRINNNNASNTGQSHVKNTEVRSNAVSNTIVTPSQSSIRAPISKVTPQTGCGVKTRKMTADINSSGGSTVQQSINTKNCGSSVRKHMNRIKNTDAKAQTESAAKRRKETEEQQMLKLQMAKEREIRVLQNRQELLKEMVMEKKLRSAEKIKKVTETRAVQRLMEEEKLKEIEMKREETERRLKLQEEKKKEQMMKRQEILMKKHAENELRKVGNDEKNLNRKLDNMKKHHEIAAENKQQNDCIAVLIQQKAIANLVPKKTNHDVSKDFPTESASVAAPIIAPVNVFAKNNVPIVFDSKATVQSSNSTFIVLKDDTASHEFISKEKSQTQGYDLTPPPKYYDSENYDISEMKSDDESDNEINPLKPIPAWARGTPFLTALKSQFAKSKRRCLKESLQIFAKVEMPVDLGLIFEGKTVVAPRYAKRTSSAVWTSPPEKPFNRTDSSSSYSRSLLE